MTTQEALVGIIALLEDHKTGDAGRAGALNLARAALAPESGGPTVFDRCTVCGRQGNPQDEPWTHLGCKSAPSSPSASESGGRKQASGEGGPCLNCGVPWTARGDDIAWDGPRDHLIGAAECPRCRFPALVKMDPPSSPSSAQGDECSCDFKAHPSSGTCLCCGALPGVPCGHCPSRGGGGA